MGHARCARCSPPFVLTPLRPSPSSTPIFFFFCLSLKNTQSNPPSSASLGSGTASSWPSCLASTLGLACSSRRAQSTLCGCERKERGTGRCGWRRGRREGKGDGHERRRAVGVGEESGGGRGVRHYFLRKGFLCVCEFCVTGLGWRCGEGFLPSLWREKACACAGRRGRRVNGVVFVLFFCEAEVGKRGADPPFACAALHHRRALYSSAMLAATRLLLGQPAASLTAALARGGVASSAGRGAAAALSSSGTGRAHASSSAASTPHHHHPPPPTPPRGHLHVQLEPLAGENDGIFCLSLTRPEARNAIGAAGSEGRTHTHTASLFPGTTPQPLVLPPLSLPPFPPLPSHRPPAPARAGGSQRRPAV